MSKNKTKRIPPDNRNRVFYRRAVLISWLQARFPEAPWAEIEDLIPPIVWRHRWNEIAKTAGLPYTKSYLENLDSRGQGPLSAQ